ncbi:MAG: flagellar hook assembly protein FlgD [Anaeromyxobacteraceae bacterium]
MSTTPITGSTPAPSQATPATAGSKELGKDEFLKLLTAQLANQDPLQPVDNQAFIAQLAQFSSVEQLHAVSSRLDTLLLATAAANQMNTASLVGKDVSFKADGVEVAAGAASNLQIKLPSRANVTAVVQDASGRTVRTLALGTREGSFDLGWDGHDEAGNAVAAGHYTVALSAKAVDGTAVTPDARARGRVSGVSFDGGATELLVGGAHVKLPDVVEITQP